MGGFPSGQRGQTVNLMASPSQVRILHPPLLETSRRSYPAVLQVVEPVLWFALQVL